MVNRARRGEGLQDRDRIGSAKSSTLRDEGCRQGKLSCPDPGEIPQQGFKPALDPLPTVFLSFPSLQLSFHLVGTRPFSPARFEQLFSHDGMKVLLSFKQGLIDRSRAVVFNPWAARPLGSTA